MTPDKPISGKFFLTLGGTFAAWWGYLAIAPLHRKDWLLENILVAFIIAFLLVTSRWMVFSRTSYLLTFVFLCLHTLAAHYTYSEVPYEEWLRSLAGWSLNGMMGWSRNHFDRFAHFLYGLLCTWPYREAFYFVASPRRTYWSYLLTLCFSAATSTLYELLEWLAAVLYGGEAGMAFLGTQGDPWDAHWDMLFAAAGVLLCFVVMLAARWLTGRDFPREWGESQGK